MSSKFSGRLIFFGICCALIFTPLAAGSVRLWFIAPVVLLSGLLTWLWLCGACFRPDEKLKRTALDKPVIVFALVILASFVLSIYKQESFMSLLRLAGFAGFYYLAVNNVDDTREGYLVNLVICVAMLLSLTGLLQYFGFLPHSKWSPKGLLAATYVNHNHFAGYLELAIPLTLGIFFERQKKGAITKVFLMLALVVMLLAFIFAQSRGAWMSLAISLSLMSVFLIKRGCIRREGVVVLSTFLFLGLFLVALNSSVISNRLGMAKAQDVEDLSWQTRQKIWLGSIEMIKDRPWTGTGIGTFAYGFPRFRPAGLMWKANFAHNDYLELSVEAGIFALIVLLWIFFTLFRQGFIQRGTRPIILGLTSGIFSLALHGAMDFNFHIPANMLLTVMFAALIMRQQQRVPGELND
ncbi:MAG TPA: hypothetical protein DCL35_03075 [Candidatus Omnitrophica bacterium]|nr:hypothetical protein [Candidatus Omnitrophota bacterium]